MTTALLDGDIYCYRVAAACDDKDEHEVVSGLSGMINDTLGRLEAASFHIFLTADNNFRREIYPLYKANRKQPKPRFLQYAKDYLIQEWNAIIMDELEADDCLAIMAGEDTVICSIDKDLQQVAGWHYNFVTDKLFEVDEVQAEFNFWKQMITGDTADNIPGIPKMGNVKATKFLQDIESFAWEDEVKALYERVLSVDHYDVYYHLLKLRRFHYETFLPGVDTYDEAIAVLAQKGFNIANKEIQIEA